MVGSRRLTRGHPQGNVDGSQRSKVKAESTTSRPKRKAAQEATYKVDADTTYISKSRGNKRVKKEIEYPAINLPREIFDDIISRLEPDAATCLSLTCKEILSIVGREVWYQCRSKRQIYVVNTCGRGSWVNFRHTLIPLLARDVSHLTECIACMTLHPSLKLTREHRENPSTKCCFGPWSTIDYLPKDSHGGNSLLWDHVLEARKSLSEGIKDRGPLIEFLEGNHMIQQNRFTYTLVSSGRQIKKNLILKHEHIFRGVDARSSLKLADMIALPIRLCPHQTTTVAPKPRGHRYTNSKLPTGLLTHSISIAVPKALQIGLPTPEMFSAPTSIDQKQMDSAVPNVKTLWTCRSCPTKWCVEYDGKCAGELKITTSHNLGDTAYKAQVNWKLFVRREVENLGAAKRNSEFYIVNRNCVDFAIDED